MIYSRPIEVDVHDVDYNGVARTSALMRYIQSSAQMQLTENGMSYGELANMNRAFLLSRITMEFTEPIYEYDRLNALTFPCESRGFSFFRCYALEKEGRTVGKAVSAWALIDTATHGLVRVDNFELGLETHEPHELVLARFIMPKCMDEVGKFLVDYGSTDRNRHMNNTVYPDMFATYLPLDGKRIHTISISYQAEAPMGELLTVLRGVDEGGVYYFRTIRKDGRVNTEAQIILTDI
ncbi:MAG: hypothetical protein IKC32_04410 [Clostridia bacterium]|nr:hypothetical protein [Clostridia bacterium]